MERVLRKWWTQKYHLPPTHEAFLAYTQEEMWVEFYEDYYENNPAAALEEFEDDDVQFVTGRDKEFDELEERLANDDISDEELNSILDGWEGGEPEESEEKQAREELLDEVGDGFEDEYGAT